MNNDDLFFTPAEELNRLVTEIEAVKQGITALSKQLKAMEDHLKKAFPELKKPKPARSATKKATKLTEAEAVSRFDQFVELARTQGREAVEAELYQLPLGVLRDFAKFQGLTGLSKKKQPEIIDSLWGRLREHLQVTVQRQLNENATSIR